VSPSRRFPHLISAADLINWADLVESRTEFPRVVRQLIRQTNDQVVRLDMRAGAGAGLGGFDGLVEAARATPFVPQGQSGWELGTGVDSRDKANRDYKKRKENHGDLKPSETTYVQVSLRRWDDRADWAALKRREGFWRDVLAFDADDLEAVLDEAPAVQFALAEILGKPASGVRTLENWWSCFSIQSSPALSPELVLGGREDEAAMLLRLLEQETRQTTISAQSADDLLAFVAATLMTSPEDERDDLLAKSLIISEAAALRYLDTADGQLILLPFDETLHREARLIASHHVVYLAPPQAPADIALPAISIDRARITLSELGVTEEKSIQLARALGRGVVAYQYVAPAGGAPTQHDWLTWLRSGALRRMWLLGSWNEGRSGDIDIATTLIGQDYTSVVDDLNVAAGGANPLFLFSGGTWAVASVELSWEYASRFVNRTDLDAFEGVVQTVLGAVDPALDLPIEERWRASIYGRRRLHSSDLRHGIATTLALLGDRGDSLRLSGGQTGQTWAANAVNLLLRRANEDSSGQLWASLSDVLPLLAEAAPEAFLSAVQEGASGDSPVLATMFVDQNGGFSISSPHAGLLWALESLAWSTEYLGLAAEVLARLTEIDPGGRLSNRPRRSLADIFRLWLPGTTAPRARQLAVLDGLRQRHHAAWRQLLLDLLPESHAVGMRTNRPRFRNWRRETDGVTYAELWEMASAITQRLISETKADPTLWPDLIGKIDDLFPMDRAAVISELRQATEMTIAPELRAKMWEDLSGLIRRHRDFASATWAMQRDVVDQLDEIVERLRPTDTVAANRWLFDDHMPRLGTGDREVTAWRAEIERLRTEAIAQVLAAEGMDGVLNLAKTSKFPWLVGDALARASSSGYDGTVLALMDTDNSWLQRFTTGYAMARSADPSWVDTALALVTSPLAKARVLQFAYDTKAAWVRASALGDDVDKHYWAEFLTHGRGPQFAVAGEAARKLVEHGRPAAAVDLLNLYAMQDRAEVPVPADLILDVLEAFVDDNGADQSVRVSSYEIESLLEQVRSADGVDQDRLALLEWRLLPALDFERGSPVLQLKLARDPQFFIMILSLCYRPANGEMEQEVPPEVASNAYRLLHDWKVVPGSTEQGGEIDETALNDWIRRARTLAAEADRGRIGDYRIGYVFAHAPADADGKWPAKAVRDVIEAIGSTSLESGFRTGIYNKRGVVTRAPGEGGAQEYELARKFGELASRISDGWPRAAAVLRDVAAWYRADGQREDEEADRYRHGFGR